MANIQGSCKPMGLSTTVPGAAEFRPCRLNPPGAASYVEYLPILALHILSLSLAKGGFQKLGALVWESVESGSYYIGVCFWAPCS